MLKRGKCAFCRNIQALGLYPTLPTRAGEFGTNIFHCELAPERWCGRLGHVRRQTMLRCRGYHFEQNQFINRQQTNVGISYAYCDKENAITPIITKTFLSQCIPHADSERYPFFAAASAALRSSAAFCF
jgi:hypothetical protein